MPVPPLRVQTIKQAPVNPDGAYVLYWMTAFRRLRYNFALERAVEWCRELHKPLLIFEPLRVGYRWASDRLHRFAIDGMADNAAGCAAAGVAYYPYVEPDEQAGAGLLEALAEPAAVVVADDYPCFFLPRLLQLAARRLQVRVEKVDSNGLLPVAAADRVFGRAYDFRRHLQKTLRPHLADLPLPDPLADRPPGRAEIPAAVATRWPAASAELLAGRPGSLAGLPIDHSVPIVPGCRGGSAAAADRLHAFLRTGLARYGDERSQPDADASSNLSPYLHWGHLSTHEILAEIARREDWQPADMSSQTNGSKDGWWGTTASTESFLDELVTWRELGFNMTARQDNYDQYESLPEWAQDTLAEHAADPRPYLYTLEEFESARTHDPVWNAAQRQLRREGVIHNYLRMLWGKKILHWSESPRAALAIMIELNNKYGLDGRDPNSYSGIFWVLGRYDRPWAPKRPVFGSIRYMTSDSTQKKLKLTNYLRRFGPRREESLF